MNKTSLGQCALSVYATAAMLAGCGGGSMSPSYQAPGMSQSTRAQSVSSAATVPDAKCQGQQSFSYTGQSQNFTVPKCATTVYVDAFGASGAYAYNGGEVGATIPVTPGETLIVMVGGQGSVAKGGGFNGGGRGADNGTAKRGASGGGASDVRQHGSTLAHRVVVAGGGGSGGRGDAGAPGSGGGIPDGGNGGNPDCNFGNTPSPGGGGTQFSGGAGGAGINGGSLGEGGRGVGYCGQIYFPYGVDHWSGGGGGGYYGGGGGANGGASGGGSGYAEPSATNVSSQSGVKSFNGLVQICWGYSDEMCGSR